MLKINNSISLKMFFIFIVGLICFGASALVLVLVSERQESFKEAKQEVASMWGEEQIVGGPVLVFTGPVDKVLAKVPHYFVLPKEVKYESILEPEVRTKGTFETVVYTETVRVSGVFSRDDIVQTGLSPSFLENAVVSVAITDTRGIEESVNLDWGGRSIPFSPGSALTLIAPSGIHSNITLQKRVEYPFSFTVTLKGTEAALFIPVGEETNATITSAWSSPQFIGAFLPGEREISDSGFDATWRVSSFGRSYPQTIEEGTVDSSTVLESAFGASLHGGVDIYTMLFRSIKYAILFIVVTFTALFLFEVLLGIRLHSIQYVLIGSALALFYLLLLSFAEQIGFALAYALATAMIVSLVTFYSRKILKRKKDSLTIALMLIALYGYLYFVLLLEDYALLFGSLLLFVLLGAVMYITRNINWFLPSEEENNIVT